MVSNIQKMNGPSQESNGDQTNRTPTILEGSKNTYGMSRVVGYYSKIENWNASKQAEFDARQQGNYTIKVQ